MNPKYKNAVNDCVKIIAFVLAFLLVLEGLSLSVLSGRNAAKFSSKLRDAYSFVDEPKDTIQIACVGNSNLYSGFVRLPFGTSTVIPQPFVLLRSSRLCSHWVLLKRCTKIKRPTLFL